MWRKDRRHCDFAWLEFSLVLACLALLFQVFPSLWPKIQWAFDVRNWPRDVWIGLNLGAVVLLFGIRFRSELRQVLTAIGSSKRQSRSAIRKSQGKREFDTDYEARARRDSEWRERARKRLPFT